MLEQVDVDKKMSKDEYEKKMESLSTRLGELQRKCKEQKIPVMVTFDGVDAAGKGTMINRVIQFFRSPRLPGLYNRKSRRGRENAPIFLAVFYKNSGKRKDAYL